MPDQPDFRGTTPPETPPGKSPTLADQHWRALLPQKKRAEVEKDMAEAIQKNDGWRFSMLLQLKKDWARNEQLLRQVIDAGRLDMFTLMTAKDPAWHKHINLSSLATAAAENGRTGLVRLFIEKYDVDIHYYNDDLLRTAASKGHEELVGYLLSKGADVTAWNGDPLRSAAENGHLGVVKKLVEAGADVKGSGDALERAVRYGRLDVAAYLLSKGADPRAGNDDALITACRNGQTEAVALLLSHGVPADARDNDGFTGACDGRFFDTARLLLAHGADVNTQGGRALRSAAYRGDMETLQFLIENNADLNLQGSYRETPLTEAVRSGKKEVVALLISKGADPALLEFEAWRIARREHKRDLQHALIDGARQHRAQVKEQHLAAFHGLFGGGYSLDDLRSRKTPEGDTGLLLAARSGKFAALVRAAKGGSSPRLEPADLFHPDDRLDSVMGVLHRNKELQQFFDPALWIDRTGAVTEAYESLPSPLQKRVQFDGITAQINQQRIMKKAKGFSNGLKPPKPAKPGNH